MIKVITNLERVDKKVYTKDFCFIFWNS